MLSAGVSAPLAPLAFVGQTSTGLLSTELKPSAAYRPFDAGANGYVPGEGGAMLLVEELGAARQRGAPRIYGEIVGYGATHDAYHHAQAASDGAQLARAMSLALEGGGIESEEVDVVFADAAGTTQGDLAEAAAIKQVFAERSSPVAVTAPKATVGRLYSGGAALDVAAALLSMRDACLPPTVNLDRPAEGCELNFNTGKARRYEVNTVLVNARGFGGLYSALVVRPVM